MLARINDDYLLLTWTETKYIDARFASKYYSSAYDELQQIKCRNTLYVM